MQTIAKVLNALLILIGTLLTVTGSWLVSLGSGEPFEFASDEDIDEPREDPNTVAFDVSSFASMDGFSEEEFSQEASIRAIVSDTVSRELTATAVHVSAMGLLRTLMVMGNAFATSGASKQMCLEGATLATAAMACERVLQPCAGLAIVRVGAFRGHGVIQQPPEDDGDQPEQPKA